MKARSSRKNKKNDYKKIKWTHKIVLPNGEVTPGEWAAGIEEYGLDKIAFKNKRVLDVGCLDGVHSFYAEEQGAKEVVAFDINDFNEGQFSRKAINPKGYNETGFLYAHKALKSKVKYIFPYSVYDLDPKKVGTFDIVLFLGVIYHLAHPILALEKLNMVMKKGGLLVLEGQVSDTFVKFYHKKKLQSVVADNKTEPTTQKIALFPRLLQFYTIAKPSLTYFLSRSFKIKVYILYFLLKSKLQKLLWILTAPFLKPRKDVYKDDISNFWLLDVESMEKALDFTGFKIESKTVNPFATSVRIFCRKVDEIDPIYAHKSIHANQKLITNFKIKK